jgi:hypothetical protein
MTNRADNGKRVKNSPSSFDKMHQEAETSIGSCDTNRIIRYIDSRPVVVANDSFDAVAHDIERFCAFRQSQLHESELSGDISVGELQKAREFRNKLLESVDKYDFMILSFHIVEPLPSCIS